MFSRFSLAVFSTTLGLALAGMTATAHADFSQYSCQVPTKGLVEAIVDNNACVGYRVKASDGSVTKTVSFPFKGSGKLIASDDGRTVVMLQSYLDGQVDAKGNIVGIEAGKEEINPIGIRIYRDGVLVKTHRIHDLLVRKQLVEPSISHIHWIREAPSEITGTSFTISTTSYRTITFDTRTGKLTKAADAPEWTRCDDIVGGQVDLEHGRLTKAYSLKTSKHISDVAFTLDPAAAPLTNKASATVCLERGDHGMILTKTL